MISKPLVPPWDDSAKNIVRSQVLRGEKYAYRVLTTKAESAEALGFPATVTPSAVYGGAGAYSPSLLQNARVLAYSLLPRGASIYHYFFAPNPLTSRAGRVVQALNRVKTVQTVCSKPASFDGIAGLLFSDRVIVLSADTRQQLLAAGVAEAKLKLVRPAVEPLAVPTPDQRRAAREANGLPLEGPIALFPGDYEFSSAAQTVARAVPRLAAADPRLTVVFACRIKRPPSVEIRDRLRRELEAAGLAGRVRFLERVADMPSLVGAVEVVLMPAESLYAKMDVPLVLLEAMAAGVPLVLANVPPLSELADFGAGLAVPPGDAEALAAATLRVLSEPACGHALGSAGKRAVAEVFSPEAMARAIEAVYDEVLER